MQLAQSIFPIIANTIKKYCKNYTTNPVWSKEVADFLLRGNFSDILISISYATVPIPK